MKAEQLKRFNLPPVIEDNIEKIFSGELPFEDVNNVVNYINDLDKSKFDELITESFQIARENNFPLNRSTADRKFMGVANWIGRTIKNIKFRFKGKRETIVAEGDSWFEHLFIKDIIDHLIKIVDQRIYTLAYGGDWIGNYLEEQKYIEALKKHKPKVFLLSGGGNDLVGGGRIATLVKSRKDVDPTLNSNDNHFIGFYSQQYGNEIATKIVTGKKFLNKHFNAICQVFLFQYLLIIKSIENEKNLKDTKIVVQGYDFAIPNNNKNTILRKSLGHSSWLYNPLMSMGIIDEFEQESVITAMLYNFNEMLSYISKEKENVYFIDIRGAAKRDDWNDELHLKSHVYKDIANTFKECIDSTDKTKKIYKVKNSS